MNKSEDISKLDRDIKDTELRIKSISSNTEAIVKEIDILSNLELKLEENIRCLKEKQIVAIAKEFKKAKEELKKTRDKLKSLKNEHEHFLKMSTELEEYVYKTQQKLDKLLKLEANNVLKFKRGVKNGQK